MKQGLYFIALRQLLARRGQTLLMLMGIILGSMGFIVISGFMIGFREYLTDQLVNNNGHITIDARVENIEPARINAALIDPGELVDWHAAPSGRRGSDELSGIGYWRRTLGNDGRVRAFSPQLTFATVMRSGKFVEPGTVVGIDVERHRRVTTIADNVIAGDLNAIGSGNVMIGEGLRKNLGLRPGDNIMINDAGGSPRAFRVAAVFQVGSRDADDRICYASLGDAQILSGQAGKVSKITVRLNRIDESAERAREWSAAGLDRVQSWEESNASFFSIFYVQDMMRFTVTAAILLVAGFGIYNILTVIINQKRREIAIMRSMGFEQGDILKIFLGQGIALGLIGGVIGIVGGWAICEQLALVEIQGPNASTPTNMNISFHPKIYFYAFGLATVTTLFSSILPARSASKLSPIDTIRGEQT